MSLYSLLRQYAWNATAYQIVNPGIVHWFSPEGDAVIGYVTRAGVRVVAGAPVCDEARLAAVLAAFAQEAAHAGEQVCYFGAAGRVFSLLSELAGHSVVVLGAQPVWNPQALPNWRPSLRAQLSRARNKGVTVREWPVTEAESHPELARVLGEWLARKPLPSMHFLVEPQTLAALTDKRVFVAEQGGSPLGFVTLAPIPARQGWLTEQFVRGRGAPNGTVELMLDAALRAIAADGAQYATMGLVPLSSGTWDPALYNPLWLRFTLGWVRAHGQRFYNFGGLEAFKAKFSPSGWEPIYAIANEPRFSPRTLWAIAAAFADRSPLSTITRGLFKAVRQEWRWLRQR
ncbi:DUF2156 domain-containing protein [Armatimonas rosea]|uniref:Phosphatidylglycerol lysyltransferase n=1 Tax=Armatimonas rosea TaxID=685828 RepID=A0A7W9SMA2_ARMRO|nr:DUF2156 domain-containing protein [Armatimonas rosea]MBB6049256.1 phosphatidylglycerol lysyltransferase [Armatimonas rosea]